MQAGFTNSDQKSLGIISGISSPSRKMKKKEYKINKMHRYSLFLVVVKLKVFILEKLQNYITFPKKAKREISYFVKKISMM